MKQFFMSTYLWMLLFGCALKQDQIKPFIPGTYVRLYDDEVQRGYDTLVIEKLSEEGLSYRLNRSVSYQQKLDGQVLPWQTKLEKWTAVYDSHTRVLTETRRGKVISFVPEKNKLLVGSTEYKKIK